MNIFFVDTDAIIAARSLVDRHVCKMIIESAQLLSTTHQIYKPNPDLYKATHINHPCNIWTRTTVGNYNWLYLHFCGLLDEYTFRYDKIHACSRLREPLYNSPRNIDQTYEQTPIPLCMPDEYKISDDLIKCYREYYRKGKKHLHKYKKRNPPEWLSLN